MAAISYDPYQIRQLTGLDNGGKIGGAKSPAPIPAKAYAPNVQSAIDNYHASMAAYNNRDQQKQQGQANIDALSAQGDQYKKDSSVWGNFKSGIADLGKGIAGGLKDHAVAAIHQSPIQSAKDVGNALSSSEQLFNRGIQGVVKAIPQTVNLKTNDQIFNNENDLNNKIRVQIANTNNPVHKANLEKLVNTPSHRLDTGEIQNLITPAQMLAATGGVALDVATLGLGSTAAKMAVKAAAADLLSKAAETGTEMTAKEAVKQASKQIALKAVTESSAQKSLKVAGVGAVYGADQSVQAGQTSAGDIATGALVGAGTGLALHGAGVLSGKMLRGKLDSAAKVEAPPVEAIPAEHTPVEGSVYAQNDHVAPIVAKEGVPSSVPAVVEPKLPSNLDGAKPKYNYGDKSFTPQFESPIDKAAYISAQKNLSKNDAAYVKFVSDHTGMSEGEVRAHGQIVKDYIKSQAKSAEPGDIKVPSMRALGHDVTIPGESNSGIKALPEEKAPQAQTQTPGSKTVPNKFDIHAANSPALSDEARGSIRLGTHEKGSQADLRTEAEGLLKSNIDELHNRVITGRGGRAEAATAVLLEHYSKLGEEARAKGDSTAAENAHKMVANIAELHSKNSALESGRAVSANKLLSSTPEGQVVRAARALAKQGDKIATPEKVARVTKDVSGKVENAPVAEHGNISKESTTKAIRAVEEQSNGKKLAKKIEGDVNPKKKSPVNNLVNELYKQIKKESLPEKMKGKAKAPIDIIKEVFARNEESKAAFAEAKKILQEKFKDSPKMLAAIDEFSKSEFSRPNSPTTTASAVAAELRSRADSIAAIVKKSLDQQKTSVEDIAKAMTDKGFSKEAADHFSKEVQSHLTERINARKISMLEQMRNSAIKKSPKFAATLDEKIAKLSNTGALTNKDYIDVARSQLKIPKLTGEQANIIHGFAQDMQRNKGTEAYGASKVALENYMREVLAPGKQAGKNVLQKTADIVGVTKALKVGASFHGIGRVGFKMSTEAPGIFVRNTAQTFMNFAREFGGKKVLDGVMAKVYNEPLYEEMAGTPLAIERGGHDEEFTTNIQNKIPLGAGRFYRANQAAYEAFNINTRVEAYKAFRENIVRAEGEGAITKERANSIATFVNQITNLGDIKGRGSATEKAVNASLFSVRAMKSNFDTLTFGLSNWNKLDSWGRKKSAMATVKTLGAITSMIYLANQFHHGTIESDPRSSDFGKVKVGDTRFDLTGGLSGFITLAAREVPTYGSDGWGRYTKSSTTGKLTKLNSGKFGSSTGLDVANSFVENRLSPAAGIIRDIMKGQTFSGDKPTIGGELSSVITPLNYDAYKEASKDPNSANKLLIMLAATLGISTATYDQGQSKPGITGVKAQIVESLNKGDRVGAQKLIDGNFVEKDRKAAMTTAEKSASNYNDPSSDMHVNFYKAYNPLATQRSATEKKVKELTVAGNLGDAHKLVVQYNASIAAALKPFTDKYGQGDAKTAKIIKSARLK